MWLLHVRTLSQDRKSINASKFPTVVIAASIAACAQEQLSRTRNAFSLVGSLVGSLACTTTILGLHYPEDEGTGFL